MNARHFAVKMASALGTACLARTQPRIRSAVAFGAVSLFAFLAPMSASALDFEVPLVYQENFVGENSFPTTSEIDVMDGGGLVARLPSMTPTTFTGTSARLIAAVSGHPEGVYAEMDDMQYSTVESNVGVRAVYSGLTSASPGKARLTSLLRFTRDDDVMPGGTLLATYLRISPLTPNFVVVRLGVLEERLGPNGMPSYTGSRETLINYVNNDMPFSEVSFISDLKVDRAAGLAVASVQIGSDDEITTDSLPLVYAQDYSVSSAQQYFLHEGENADPFEVDLDSFQVFAQPYVFEPLFNIDMGSSVGTPADSYAAAGFPGYWNPFALGPNTLRDVDGVTVPATAFLNANSFDQVLVGGEDARLLADWAEDAAGWAVTFADLARDGAYRVKVYTMADGLAESGALVANDEPHETLLGVALPSLVEGDSYAVIDTLVEDGKLTVSSFPTFAGVPPNTHLAGLQIETTVPLPEPGMISMLAVGMLGLAASRRTRRRRRTRI
ncbi:MAG: hypothetical protein AB8G23_02595 [Myxococcota bacterium]